MKSRIAAVLALAIALSTGAAFAKTTKAQNSNTPATNMSGGMKTSKHRRHRRARKHRRAASKAAAKNTNS